MLYLHLSIFACLCKQVDFLSFFFFPLFFFFAFLELYPWHMEVPRLEVESELWLLASATATAMQDPSHVFDLHHSSCPGQIFNPLSEARDRTHVLTDTSWICFRCATTGIRNTQFLIQITHPVPGLTEVQVLFSFSLFFLGGAHQKHMDVPRLGVELGSLTH